MKHVKAYESSSDEIEDHIPKIGSPQIGEYVICEEENRNKSEACRKFLQKNIGQIIRYVEYGNNFGDNLVYLIQYNNVPDKLEKYFRIISPNCRTMSEDEIKFHSYNIDDLEILFSANKYNL